MCTLFLPRVMWDRATSLVAATSTDSSLPDGLTTTMFTNGSGVKKEGENEESMEMTPQPINGEVEKFGGNLVP